MNYILSSRNRKVGTISEAVFDIQIPSRLLTEEQYTIRLGEFSTINSIYKLNVGDYMTLQYGETTKTLEISTSNQGVYNNINEYIALIQTEMPELSITFNTYQQKCTFSVTSDPVFSMTMSRAFCCLLGFNNNTMSGYTTYTSDCICDQTPKDYLKIDIYFTNLNRTLNQNTISLVHCQVPSYYKFSTSDNLFSMLVSKAQLLGSLITVRILDPIDDSLIKLNSDYTMVLNIS
jgi:hypothetical protein